MRLEYFSSRTSFASQAQTSLVSSHNQICYRLWSDSLFANKSDLWTNRKTITLSPAAPPWVHIDCSTFTMWDSLLLSFLEGKKRKNEPKMSKCQGATKNRGDELPEREDGHSLNTVTSPHCTEEEEGVIKRQRFKSA